MSHLRSAEVAEVVFGSRDIVCSSRVICVRTHDYTCMRTDVNPSCRARTRGATKQVPYRDDGATALALCANSDRQPPATEDCCSSSEAEVHLPGASQPTSRA